MVKQDHKKKLSMRRVLDTKEQLSIRCVLNTKNQERVWYVQLEDGTNKWITKKKIEDHNLLTSETRYIINGFGSRRRFGKNKPVLIPVFLKGFNRPSIMPYDEFKTQYMVYRSES